MTSFLLHIESPDRHYQTLTKPSTCTVRSRRHGHSKASARAIRAGLDITAQGGWRCTCLHMSDSVPALSPIRSYCLDASLAYCVLPLLLDRTSAASGYSTSRATSSRARWNSYATAKHSTPVPAAAFFYFTQGAWRFHPRCGASLLPLSQPTVAELLQPQFLLPAIRRAQWALHVTSTSSSRRPHALVHPYYVKSRFGRGAPELPRRHARRMQRARTVEPIEARLGAPRRPAVGAVACARRPRRAKNRRFAGWRRQERFAGRRTRRMPAKRGT